MRVASPLPQETEQIVTSVVDCGFTVHRTLGPGFRESIYKRAFCLELTSRGLAFECEKSIEVRYKEWRIPGQKIDLIVADVVLVELKAVPKLRDVHRKQVLSYLKTMNLRIGLLINFNTLLFKHGVRRVIF